jgi:hypothetical protein
MDAEERILTLPYSLVSHFLRKLIRVPQGNINPLLSG